MAGEKLPLFYVAKGRRNSCKKQLGNNPEVLKNSTFYSTGWMGQSAFEDYLRFLRTEYNSGPLWLMLDQYTTHTR
jgi:hypothetical protein